jgi:2-phosphosulfolactate phosphatase
MPSVRVALLPSALPSNLNGHVAVVIDVLRATTTIIHALASGAVDVAPCGEVDEAFALRDRLGRDHCVLGGERGGLLIEGFQLDNSPFSYTSAAVAAKTVVFTTTNGTRAVLASRSAERILIGAFVNRRAIIDELRRAGRPVWLVCAGTDGGVTAEDVLFAGSVALELGVEPASGQALSVSDVERLPAGTPDAERIAARFARDFGQTVDQRLAAMCDSRGGQNLLENGFDRDIARAAEDSLFDRIPEWRNGRITA